MKTQCENPACYAVGRQYNGCCSQACSLTIRLHASVSNCNAKAERIAALEAENAKLREALEGLRNVVRDILLPKIKGTEVWLVEDIRCSEAFRRTDAALAQADGEVK